MRRAFWILLLVGFAANGVAQPYPSKPIRLVVGYPPGGSGDFTARIAADELSKDLGVGVVVENRAGAGGNIAAELVAKAPADGYTLLNAWNHAINLALYKTSSYSEKDFVAISGSRCGRAGWRLQIPVGSLGRRADRDGQGPSPVPSARNARAQRQVGRPLEDGPHRPTRVGARGRGQPAGPRLPAADPHARGRGRARVAGAGPADRARGTRPAVGRSPVRQRVPARVPGGRAQAG